jgi:gamma-glutamylcyclotransferase
MLYFAYCTLLDESEMARYCPGAVARGTGRISGWRVGFAAYAAGRGGCQLIPEPGHEVYGLLYELSDAEMAGLDEISGVPQGFYRRIDVQVTGADGATIPAITYLIPDPVGHFAPSDEYVRPILAGARAVALPESYIAELEAVIAARHGGA